MLRESEKADTSSATDTRTSLFYILFIIPYRLNLMYVRTLVITTVL